MTSIAFPAADLPITISNGIAQHVTAAVRAALARMRARHEYRCLLERDDQLLRDMGVTRTDVCRDLADCAR